MNIIFLIFALIISPILTSYVGEQPLLPHNTTSDSLINLAARTESDFPRKVVIYMPSGDGNVYALDLRDSTKDIVYTGLTNPRAVIFDYTQKNIIIANQDEENKGYIWAYKYHFKENDNLRVHINDEEVDAYYEGVPINDIYPAQDAVDFQAYFIVNRDGIYVCDQNLYGGDLKQLFYSQDADVGIPVALTYETGNTILFKQNFLYWLSEMSNGKAGILRARVYYHRKNEKNIGHWENKAPEVLYEFDAKPYGMDKAGPILYITSDNGIFQFNEETRQLVKLNPIIGSPRGIRYYGGRLYVGDVETSSIYEYHLGRKELRKLAFDVFDPRYFFVDSGMCIHAGLIALFSLLALF